MIFCIVILILIICILGVLILTPNKKKELEQSTTEATTQEVVDNVESENEDIEEEVVEEPVEEEPTTTNATTKTTTTKKATTNNTTKVDTTTKAPTTTTTKAATTCTPEKYPSDVIWYKLWGANNPGDDLAEYNTRTELAKLNPNMKALTDYNIVNIRTFGGSVSIECTNMPGYYYGIYWHIGLGASPNYDNPNLQGKAYVKPDGSIYWVWKNVD